MIYKFLYETQNIHCMLSIRSVKPETGLWEDAMSFSGPYRPFVDTINTRSSSSSLSLCLLLSGREGRLFCPRGRLTDSPSQVDSPTRPGPIKKDPGSETLFEFKHFVYF